jgi:hypothetical protein
MLKLGMALAILTILAALSWFTLSDMRVRLVTLAVMGGFAVKIWTEHKRRSLEEQDSSSGTVGRE